jgi:hypothetical protein
MHQAKVTAGDPRRLKPAGFLECFGEAGEVAVADHRLSGMKWCRLIVCTGDDDRPLGPRLISCGAVPPCASLTVTVGVGTRGRQVSVSHVLRAPFRADCNSRNTPNSAKSM